MNKITLKWWYLITQTVYKRGFHRIGAKSVIYKPLQIDSANSIYIGDGVYIAAGSWLMGETKEGLTCSIKDSTTIGHFAHIIAKHSVTIENDVLIADKVFISDCTHGYEDINAPVIKQDIKLLSPVVIGEGSWLGENVCVCGASIGKHCVIGANSVVTTDIPDYCVAVGSPARVVKRYDFEKNEWVKV